MIKNLNETAKILQEFNRQFQQLTPVEATSGEN